MSSGTVRITDRPITLAGHRLPAGQPIIIPFWAVHRSPRLWQDPDSFRPERFLAPDTAAPTEKTFNSNSNSSRTTGEIKAAAAAGPSHEDQADKAEWPDSSWGSSTTEDTPAEADTGEGGEQPGDVGVCAPGGLIEDDDYVDVAADMAAIRDQALRQGNSPGFVAEGKGHTISKPVRGTAMQTTTSSSSSSNVSDVRPDTKHSKHASADGADGGSRPRADKTKRPALELKVSVKFPYLPTSLPDPQRPGQQCPAVHMPYACCMYMHMCIHTMFSTHTHSLASMHQHRSSSIKMY